MNWSLQPLVIQPLATHPLAIQPLGTTPAEHAVKLHPWTVRLDSATALLARSAKAYADTGDSTHFTTTLRALDDTSFWIGRLVCDVLGSPSGGPDVEANRVAAVRAIIAAQRAVERAHLALRA
jgi:hypothetical protein